MENVNIKDVLTEISSKIIEENNKPFDFKKFKKTGVGNHIYNEEGFQLKMGFELLKKFDLNGNIEFEKVYHNIEKGKKEKTDIYFFLNCVLVPNQNFPKKLTKAPTLNHTNKNSFFII